MCMGTLHIGSVSSVSSSVLHGRKDLTLSSNAVFTQSSTQQHLVSETTKCIATMIFQRLKFNADCVYVCN